MKFAFATLASASLWGTVAVSRPVKLPQPASADIALQTGEEDTTVSLSLPVNKLIASTPQTCQGVSAFAATDGIYCRAFEDVEGLYRLGGAFTSSIKGIFSSNGSPVVIGSFCCATDPHGFAACAATPAASTLASTTSAANAPVTTISRAPSAMIRVQLSGTDEAALQVDVPVDKSVFVFTEHPPTLTVASEAFILYTRDATRPSCQAYSDSKGTIPIGSTITTKYTMFSPKGHPVEVQSLRCTEGLGD